MSWLTVTKIPSQQQTEVWFHQSSPGKTNKFTKRTYRERGEGWRSGVGLKVATLGLHSAGTTASLGLHRGPSPGSSTLTAFNPSPRAHVIRTKLHTGHWQGKLNGFDLSSYEGRGTVNRHTCGDLLGAESTELLTMAAVWFGHESCTTLSHAGEAENPVVPEAGYLRSPIWS